MGRKIAVALVLGLMMVASAACTQDPDPPTSAEAPPESAPVTWGSDAERTIYLWDPETGDVEALFSAPSGLDDAERSPDGRRVVYERLIDDGPSQIYVAEADGTGRPLTDLAGGAYDPTWSPDGKTIAFAGSQVEGSDLDIYTVELAGGEERRTARTWKDDGRPDWSPDGRQIVFDSRTGDLRSGPGAIWVTSVRTGELHRLTPPGTGYAATAPAWSPGGRWIAYRVYEMGVTLNGWPWSARLWLMRPDGSGKRRIGGQSEKRRVIHAPSWSPDGRSIVTQRSNWSEDMFQIILFDPRTREARSVLKGIRGDSEPSWGTDGILLTLWSDDPVPSEPAPSAFQVEAEGLTPRSNAEPLADLGAGIYVVDVRTGETSRFPEAFRSIEGAGDYEVSPDDSMILFDNANRTTASDQPAELGHHQLYVANVDGSNLRQVTDDPVGASQGSWSPDGTKVVYLGGWARLCCWHSPADLMVLDLATGTSTRVTTGRAKAFYEPFFSADVGTIVFTRYHYEDPSDQYDLWSIPVGGGHPTRVLEDAGYGASYSPDGTEILYQRTATAFGLGNRCASSYGVGWISDADGNLPRLLVPRAGEEPRGSSAAAGWSPDGTRIAYRADLAPPDGCSLDSGSGIYVKDLETGARTLIAFGEPIDWLDDRTVLIKAQRGR
jgi:Tol biopolymer transport system component